MNARQLRYPLIVGSVLLLIAAVYSDAQRWNSEPLIEFVGMVSIMTTAAIWWK